MRRRISDLRASFHDPEVRRVVARELREPGGDVHRKSISGGSARARFALMLDELVDVRRRAYHMDDLFTETLHPRVLELIDAYARECAEVGYVPAALRRRKRKPTRDELRAALRASGRTDGATDEQLASLKAAGDEVRARWLPVERGLEFRKRELEHDLDALAGAVEISPSSAPREVEVVRAHAFSSQTWPEGYARDRARSRAEEMRAHGVHVEVVRVPKLCDGSVEKSDAYGRTWADYKVVAWVAEELDCEVLRRRSVPLREQVRIAWKNGVNPRVLAPLPPDYERRGCATC